MLDVLEARQTLYDAISAAAGILIPANAQVFPGGSINTKTLPRLEVVQVSSQHPVRDLKGNIYSEDGVVQIFVVGEKGNGEAMTMAVAQTIANAMPVATKYSIAGGGVVELRDHPNIRPGYADDTSWRVPIELQYLARG